MKKIIALTILILLSVSGYSQYKAVYSVATDSTAFGWVIPKNGLIFDYGANVLYLVDTLGNMSSTIKTLGLDRVNSGSAVSSVNATYLDPNTCQLSLKIDTITGCNKVAIRGGLDIDTVMTMNGYFLLYQNEPLGNIMFGRGAGDVMIYDTIPHYFNTAIGINALNANKGDQNTAIGLNAGMQNRGSNNIFIGYRAANYDTSSSNLLVINSIDRDTLPNDITRSIIYGIQNTYDSLQTLNLNANVNTSWDANIHGNIINGSLINKDTVITIADSTSPFAFPTSSTGWAEIYIDSLGYIVSFANTYWSINSAVTLINNGSNVVTTNTDDKHCIFDEGSYCALINRRASSYKYMIKFHYNL